MTDRNEALRLADAARIAELEQALDRLQGNYLIAFERGRIAGIAELEKEALAKPFAPDWAGYRQGLEDGKREGQAERDQLRAEVERTSNNRDMWKGQCERQAEQLAQIRAEVERYRHLRNGQSWPAVFATHDAPEPLRGGELDAAIDAARTHKDTP